MIAAEPPLPNPRGPLSTALIAYLRGDASSLPCRPVRTRDGIADEDLQLALYCCYELHYRGFESVSAVREWDADVIRFPRRSRAGIHPGAARRHPPATRA